MKRPLLYLIFICLTLGAGVGPANATGPADESSLTYEQMFTPAERAQIEKEIPADRIQEWVNYANQPSSGFIGMAAAAPNGCSSPLKPSPYLKIFRNDCNKHDVCYTSRKSRLQCDRDFRANMLATCKRLYPNIATANRRNCDREANAFYWGVRWFGKNHYKGSGDRK